MTGLYHGDIISLARANINAGVLPNAPMAKQTNPWCGDECTISAAFDNGRIVKSLHQTRGCILCLAAAAKATTIATQLGDPSQFLALANTLAKTLQDNTPPESLELPKGLTLPEGLELFTPAIPAKNRHNCILLPFQALTELIQTQNI